MKSVLTNGWIKPDWRALRTNYMAKTKILNTKRGPKESTLEEKMKSYIEQLSDEQLNMTLLYPQKRYCFCILISNLSIKSLVDLL